MNILIVILIILQNLEIINFFSHIPVMSLIVGIMTHSLLKWWLTIGMVAIIFLYKLISSSFVIISSYTSLSERENGEGRELK